MELTAVLEGLRWVISAGLDAAGVEVVSDSTYVVNCFRDGWWKKWERNGWQNSKRQAVANTDLWKPLIEIVKGADISFRWVKGHSGDPMNDFVDALAVAAMPR
jgi:ribonuclease HI